MMKTTCTTSASSPSSTKLTKSTTKNYWKNTNHRLTQEEEIQIDSKIVVSPSVLSDMLPSTTMDKQDDDPNSTAKLITTQQEEDGGSQDILLQRRKQVIRSSWRAIQFGLDVKATELFYNKLFEEHPQVRAIFPTDMSGQYKKLYSAVSLVVQFLDEPEQLMPVLKDLGIRHSKYGASRDLYEAVTECFLWTLNSYIISKMPNNNALRWAFDVADAWEWALTFIGGTMADAADEEVARIRDDEEARAAIEEALRISGSFEDDKDSV